MDDMILRRVGEVLEIPAAFTIKAGKMPQKWVPVSVGLPEPEEKVWIQTASGKTCFAMHEDGTISEENSNCWWYDIIFEKWDEEGNGIIPEGWWEITIFHPDCEFDCPVDEEVVAWMPLPELYEE